MQINLRLEEYLIDAERLTPIKTVNNCYFPIFAYEAKDKNLKTDVLMEYWEEVDFHSAIETQYVPIYATIWQGIYGVKMAIDNGKPVADVRVEQEKLNHALWQALGAVKLASQYQKKGLIDQVKTTEVEPTTGPEVIDDILRPQLLWY